MLMVQAQNEFVSQVLWPIYITLSTRPWLKRTPVIPEMLFVNHPFFDMHPYAS